MVTLLTDLMLLLCEANDVSFEDELEEARRLRAEHNMVEEQQ